MSVKSFIVSLRRFLARRGRVKVFYSDNAKTFRSSCEILKGFKSIIRQPEPKSFITSEGIAWKFIPERSPWWGGFWERLMRSIEEPLRNTLGRALLTLEELSTILTEIESVINNRPITYDSDELDEPRALTPSHFLLPGHRNTGFVPEYFLDLFVSASDRVTLNRRKLFQTKLLKQLWVKWKEQYLLMLKSAHNLANPSSYNNLKIGDIVLVEGASKSKLLWEMGVIHEVIMGRDGFRRNLRIPDIEVLQDKLNILVKRETDLQTLDETINGQIKLVELEKEVEHELEYSDSIIRCKGKIWRFIDKHRCTNVDAAVITRQVNNTKLPRIVLDKFGGDVRKFHEFWPSFEAAVHDNLSLTIVKKFNYLRSLLIGDAARAISGLTLTNENYDKAVEVLKDRFGQKQAVISAYMNTLLSLQPVRRINDTLGLRNLYDEINNSIRSLESLGIDIDSYGNLLYPILDRCIPVELMLLFNRDQVVKGVKEPVVSDLIHFLKGEMEARERTFSERTELITIAKSNYPLFKKTQTASFNRGGSSAAALNVSIGKFCDFCPKEMHRNEDCKLSMHDKYKALYDQYKCRRCLRKGHKKKFCNVKGIKCKTCGSQYHWEYLCDKGQKSNKNGNISGASSDSRDVGVNSLFRESMIDTGNRNIIYYQTARANVVGSNKIIRGIRILIDNGSETSFLLESFAEEVGLPTVSIEKLKIHTFGSQAPHLRELERKRILLKDPNSGSQLECNILVIDKIVGVDLIRIPSKGITSVLRQKGFVLSDQGSEDTEIDLLIGNDLMNKILTGKTYRL
ncbi:hypothetical protein AVEN_47070-1 [Araneus ventricosus]|uniref:Integrase catalytic domain-containing protein n=1 Tax=Araneus ventricosus TaxID=182803 RepID=A0A4Y2MCR8_ARAVE|nr:hypothetical protein AVEN_47070-1 [Araneus ventricosus]